MGGAACAQSWHVDVVPRTTTGESQALGVHAAMLLQARSTRVKAIRKADCRPFVCFFPPDCVISGMSGDQAGAAPEGINKVGSLSSFKPAP
jgi:hypothetical protein